MASIEENKAVVRRAYVDGLNRKDMGIIDEVFAPEYVAYFPGVPPVRGRDAMKELLAAFLAAFPDIVFTIEDQIAEGEKVATRWTAHGTHQGEFRGFPPKTHGDPCNGQPGDVQRDRHLPHCQRQDRRGMEHPRTAGRDAAVGVVAAPPE